MRVLFYGFPFAQLERFSHVTILKRNLNSHKRMRTGRKLIDETIIVTENVRLNIQLR